MLFYTHIETDTITIDELKYKIADANKIIVLYDGNKIYTYYNLRNLYYLYAFKILSNLIKQQSLICWLKSTKFI